MGQAILLMTLSVLMLAPFAAGGTATDPEVPDPAGDAEPPLGCSDILAVWVEADMRGAIAVHAQVASCNDPPEVPLAYWSIDFDIADRSFYIYADRDAQQGWGFWHGALENGTPVEHLRAPLEYAPGAPATLRMPYPPAVAAIAPGEELRFVSVVSGAYSSFQEASRFDEAEAMRSFLLPERAEVETEPQRAPVPAIPFEIVVLLLATLALSRR